MTLLFRLFRFTLLFAVLTVIQSGCEKTQSLTTSDTEHEWAPEDELTLNKDKKWKVDDHTRNSIARMRVLVDTTKQDKLGIAMAGEIKTLFEDCTMQGPAHDQLHVFLTGLLGGVNGLYSSKTPEERSVEVTAIRKSLKQFDTFFE